MPPSQAGLDELCGSTGPQRPLLAFACAVSILLSSRESGKGKQPRLSASFLSELHLSVSVGTW